MSQDLHSQVREFMRAMGQPVLDRPQVPSTERVRLRLKLIAEEFLELLEACGVCEDYLIEMRVLLRRSIGSTQRELVSLSCLADALGDLDYVVEGFRAESGIDGRPIAHEIHRSNLAKLGPDGRPIIRSDGKVTKPENWQPPAILEELERQGY